MSETIVGLDIGTSTVRAVIGVFTENGELQITGVGKSPSNGLRNGAIINLEAAMSSVTDAIEAAEMMAGHEVLSVYTAIGGSQVSSMNSTGVVGVAGNGKGTQEISQRDIERVLEAAKSVPIDMARQIIHVIPQTYTIDGQKGIKSPLGNVGVRLEAEVHIVTAAVTSIQNLIRCIKRAKFDVEDIRLKTLAAAEAITTEEERDLGSIIIDLGGGSTDALVITDGAPVCSVSIPLGGATVTNDISVVRGISFESAERIKKSSGCCYEALLDEVEEVIIPGLGGRPPEAITRHDLCSYIQPRVEEILTMVRDKIGATVKDRKLSGNVILCGGGALLPGIVEVAGEVFDTRNVRIGIPANFGGLQEEYRAPEYAVAVGLVVANAKSHGTLQTRKESDKKKNTFLTAIKEWFKEFV